MKEPAYMPSENKAVLGMAYVPYQRWENIYEPTVGLDRGTLFKDLDKPWIGEEAVPRG